MDDTRAKLRALYRRCLKAENRWARIQARIDHHLAEAKRLEQLSVELAPADLAARAELAAFLADRLGLPPGDHDDAPAFVYGRHALSLRKRCTDPPRIDLAMLPLYRPPGQV